MGSSPRRSQIPYSTPQDMGIWHSMDGLNTNTYLVGFLACKCYLFSTDLMYSWKGMIFNLNDLALHTICVSESGLHVKIV